MNVWPFLPQEARRLIGFPKAIVRNHELQFLHILSDDLTVEPVFLRASAIVVRVLERLNLPLLSEIPAFFVLARHKPSQDFSVVSVVVKETPRILRIVVESNIDPSVRTLLTQ